MAKDSGSGQRFEPEPTGRMESSLVHRAAVPKQGDERAPNAWLIADEWFRHRLFRLEAGAEAIVPS